MERIPEMVDIFVKQDLSCLSGNSYYVALSKSTRWSFLYFETHLELTKQNHLNLSFHFSNNHPLFLGQNKPS